MRISTGAIRRADPHGLRHTHKTVMEELGTLATLTDERMGHKDGSVQARYSLVTVARRRQLPDGLTELWAAALDAPMALSPGSTLLSVLIPLAPAATLPTRIAERIAMVLAAHGTPNTIIDEELRRMRDCSIAREYRPGVSPGRPIAASPAS
jgi:hypothetical protein